ncbi:MAG: fibrillarin-like rRNA/tRNA 2'-O-methyltransferase, partial [Candidatus Aenigmarchaeota archaeon]|nr:fibrillarin-like rRNA/tRNA 2'-O-methyltransferase [Candidatus Aenigmarchaeota archaeon]
VWKRGKQLFTKGLVKGDVTYSKGLMSMGADEFREWDPNKSKPAAAIMRGIREFPLEAGSKVLYLGAASGATASFFSDIVGSGGVIYAIEVSERSVRDLNITSEKRGNIIPILADARKPEEYGWIEPVDVVYEDVASDDQIPIIIRNASRFLKKGGYAVIAIKARSIDVTKDPKKVFREELVKLERSFKVIDKVELEPYELDHMFVVMRTK